MEITEVRIKLMEDSEDRLRAFCSVTFDHCFVVRDLKIIEGTSGLFVAMPSRKMMARCRRCGCKNHLRSRFCNNCGVQLSSSGQLYDEGNPNKLYADIAHPINQQCRDAIQQAVMAEYEVECRRASEPGYASRYDDGYEETAAIPQRSASSEWVRVDPQHTDIQPSAAIPASDQTTKNTADQQIAEEHNTERGITERGITERGTTAQRTTGQHTDARPAEAAPHDPPVADRVDSAGGINPPHPLPPRGQTTPPGSSSSVGGQDSFGAGIFDDPR